MGKKFTPALAYDFLTPLFDRVLNLLGYGKTFKRLVLELAEIRNGEKILDVGCGSGKPCREDTASSILLVLASRDSPIVAFTN